MLRGFSLEERRSRFLFGITTVIRQLTSSPRAETHGDHVSHGDSTVRPPSVLSHVQQSKLPLLPTDAGWSPCRCDRKFV